MKKKFIPLIVVAAVLMLSVLYFEVFRHAGGNNGKIEGSGTIEVTEVEISSKIAGRVIEVTREEGEKARKGELIVRLDYDELSAQRSAARANFVNARKNLERARRLFNSGSVSKRDYDNAVAAHTVAKGNYDRVRASIENAIIFSPIKGTVLERNLEPGEMAFPGTPILTLADLKRTWIRIYVKETELGYVKIGQKAEVFVDSFPDTPFPGKVVAISNRAEFTPKTIQTKDERVKLMFAVKIAMDNPDEKLKPGMPADALIITGEEK